MKYSLLNEYTIEVSGHVSGKLYMMQAFRPRSPTTPPTRWPMRCLLPQAFTSCALSGAGTWELKKVQALNMSSLMIVANVVPRPPRSSYNLLNLRDCGCTAKTERRAPCR
jgi:hypothetical protein